MTRAQRLKRVFGSDIETCAACGGAVRIIACIEDAQVIEKIPLKPMGEGAVCLRGRHWSEFRGDGQSRRQMPGQSKRDEPL